MPFHFDRPSKIVGLNYSDDHVLHSRSLRFSVTPNPFGAGTAQSDTDDARRLISAVAAALALRSTTNSDDLLDELEINLVYGSLRNRFIDTASGGLHLFRHGHAADVTSHHLAAWLRFGARRVTRRFALAVPVPPPRHHHHHHHQHHHAAAAKTTKQQQKNLCLSAAMPAAARAETMSLALGNASLAVPPLAAAAGAFAALTDLLLSHARVEIDGGGADSEGNLGRLLSAASCPRLRRLRIQHVSGLAALRLRSPAETLEEVGLEHARDLAALELHARGLRALRVAGCYRMGSSDDEAAAVDVAAPALETLACADMCRPERVLRFDGVQNVRRLDGVFLWSHGHPAGYSNAGALWLLRNCTAAHSLGVHISPPVAKNWRDMEEMMSPVPQLPRVTNLTVDAQWQHLEASIAKLIARCSGLQRLSIHISRPSDPCCNPRCFCAREREAGWDEQRIYLERLNEVKITGLQPSDSHLRLVRRVIASAPALQRLTVELYIGKDLDCSRIRCDRGRWAPCVVREQSPSTRAYNKVYEWTPYRQDKRGRGQ